MKKEDPQVTAAACRYILVALLQRLERISPSLLDDLQSGIAGDHQSMAANGNLSNEIEVSLRKRSVYYAWAEPHEASTFVLTAH